MVVGRRHFDDVRPDQVESFETAYQSEEFAARQAADLGCTRGRSVGGVEDVDVDRDVERMVADRGPQLLDHVGDRARLEGRTMHDGEPQFRVVVEIFGCVQCPANADVRAVACHEQPLLGGATKRCAVGQRGVELRVPGVEVSVEVHQRHWSVAAVMRPQQGIGDRVVAAEADKLLAAVDQCRRLLLDLAYRDGDVVRVQMMSPASTTCWLANGDTSSAGCRAAARVSTAGCVQVRIAPWPIADAGVERNTDHRDVAAIDVFDARQPGERRQPGIAGHDLTVDRPDRLRAHALHLVEPPLI
jgi:hypothetical protein